MTELISNVQYIHPQTLKHLGTLALNHFITIKLKDRIILLAPTASLILNKIKIL
jgi:hypothetical protein